MAMRGTGRRERRSSQRRAQRLTARTWALMGGAVLVLVAILVALLFFSGSGEGDGGRLPNVGDHWHSSYSITLCGETEPPFVASPGNIHTHGDGLFHIHPTRRGEAGLNANLARLMSSTGSRLTDDSIETVSGAKYTNGDLCPDQQPGQVFLRVNGITLPDIASYVPRDGDEIELGFGPP